MWEIISNKDPSADELVRIYYQRHSVILLTSRMLYLDHSHNLNVGPSLAYR